MMKRITTRFLRHKRDIIVIAVFLCIFSSIALASTVHERLMARYASLFSGTIVDRNGDIIMREENARGAYTREGTIPKRLEELLIAKEDRWFYFHPGLNPWSLIRVTAQFAIGHRYGGASTITQQLAKIILHNEDDRGLWNKTIETLDAFVLELFHSKQEILAMYARVAYLGNGAMGFPEASMRYFGRPLETLSDSELVALVAALGSPSTRNPWAGNERYVKTLSQELGVPWQQTTPLPKKNTNRDGDAAFELRSLHASCPHARCQSTIDQTLNAQLREIAHRVTTEHADLRATNAAIVVMELPSRKLLALVGSPDPHGDTSGAAYNMAILPRQAGSTVKPLIYAAGFTKGLRPYSLVDDTEERYDIATGFPLYPKNYDGIYHGRVTLEHALGNSFNVPAVKVLAYVGLPDFITMLVRDLGFHSDIPLESYQYGIALGGLETDLMTLTHMLSLFGTEGMITPIRAWEDDASGTIDALPPMDIASSTQVFDKRYVGLVNAILSDRTIGVEQFGLKSNLSVSRDDVAVKTGTSRDYHDSWAVGWTGDFIVGVWVGNAENKPLKEVSGSSGAGKIWHDTMEILLQSRYNKNSSLHDSAIVTVGDGDDVGYGLRGEDPLRARDLLIDDHIILSPHDGDTFMLTPDMVIPLVGRNVRTWSSNDIPIGTGTSTEFRPLRPGSYRITASGIGKSATITVQIEEGDKDGRQPIR